MPTIPTADALRTLNLAYRHLQRDFRTLMPDLFRDKSTLTTDASGWIYLPTYVLEVEDVRDSNNRPVGRIDRKNQFDSSGYFHDGMDTAGNSNDGKRRLMIRESGEAKAANASYTVYYTREYSDLATTAGVPYPFTGKAYLDMLVTLQAYYWLAEQGDERTKEKKDRLDDYKMQLQMAGFDALDDEPEYLTSTHSDAGNPRSYPILNPSTS
jgi:hypothetical protein